MYSVLTARRFNFGTFSIIKWIICLRDATYGFAVDGMIDVNNKIRTMHRQLERAFGLCLNDNNNYASSAARNVIVSHRIYNYIVNFLYIKIVCVLICIVRNRFFFFFLK